ncbi:MAG: hypothetical protein ACFFB8_06485 [Promethearchaeota archaeon]
MFAILVSRKFAEDTKYLTNLIIQGKEHEAFSFIEVLQSAVPYYRWEEYRKQIEYLEKETEIYFNSIKVTKEKPKFTIGVFYRTTKPVYYK